ncbi:hypothetical protein MMC16_003996 [Acarospora aff. strigata]|nr:hypothetical protein [Acarospora aff. strigata]
MIFLEAFPVTFTVNTFAWMNDEAAKESLGKHFDLIRRVEFQTTFVQSRQIILPASCRMLRVQMILEADTYDRGKPPQRVVVVARSAWAATMEQWRKDGVKEIAMIVWCRNFKGLNPPQPLPQGSGPGWKIDKYPWNLLDGVWTEHPW